jgi:sugar O-acyltransferase (sialic acid O-acetyltransferase NeuD family)
MALKQPIVIIGAGGYGRTVHDAIACGEHYEVTYFIDKNVDEGARLGGVAVMSEDAFLASGYDGAIVVALGDNAIRETVAKMAMQHLPQAHFPVITHPRAIVSKSAQVGVGSVILGGAVVGAHVTLGQFTSIWSNAVIEHDSIAHDFATLAPSATTGGGVTLGARTFLGLGSQVLHNMVVGADCVVSAGAVVTAQVADLSVMVGVPAACKRTRQRGESYL